MVLIYRGLVLEEGDGHKKLLARKERRRAKLGRENSTFQVLWFYGEEYKCFILVQPDNRIQSNTELI
jgi:hypothetical protein